MEGDGRSSRGGGWVSGGDGTKVEGSTSYATGFEAGEEGGVTGGGEGHVGATDCDGVVGVSCSVGEEAVGSGNSFEGWACLGGGKGCGSREESGVKGTCVV